MNKQALSLIEKLLKSGKFRFTGQHTTYCKNTCIYGLFEKVYGILTNVQKTINCDEQTYKSSEFILKGSDVSIAANGFFHSNNKTAKAVNIKELLERLKQL